MKKYNLIEKAGRIAIIAHKDQKRKTDDFPYIDEYDQLVKNFKEIALSF